VTLLHAALLRRILGFRAAVGSVPLPLTSLANLAGSAAHGRMTDRDGRNA
jgi:hypothetical protein